MYQNLLELHGPRGILYLLGVQVSEPRFSSLGYLSGHSAPEGTVYTTPDAEDPSIQHRIVTLTAIKPGWHHFAAENPAFALEAPAPFMVLGEQNGDSPKS